jgi:peptidoglycan/LPS O-acetylase OafA/YrhL
VLDGLRGIAVLLVMLMHQSLLPHGYIGVDLFFGLSGFLITSMLLDEWDRRGSVSLRRFYER